MNLEQTDRVKDLIVQVSKFMDDHIWPAEEIYASQMDSFREEGNPWRVPPVIEELKTKAKAQGLWNFFLPESQNGFGLTNLEYAPLAEIMGQIGFASEVFNCSAPDSGNMEVLDKYGSKEQQDKWLKPLLEGEIRSAFAMTEPGVASSDATNICSTIEADGNDYVINGEKWWTSGFGNPDCKVMIFMGVTNPDNPRHQRQSQILVPTDAEGINLERMLTVYGVDHAPGGHAHLTFKDVRVPRENLILGEGRGFEIAQGRLGPGRIHHCMRMIGQAERALELLCKRSTSRIAFGKPLAELGGNYDVIADCRTEIEMCRLLTLKAAYMMDTVGNKIAKSEIAQIKVAVPSMVVRVIDKAIQIHGGAGVSQDTPLARLFTSTRFLRIGDGPDEVHRRAIARAELSKYNSE
ncbi:MAG: acyl-CoA dehydrogenase family protein [SAR324 cluster bacterium]|nr:acyl-CoA dehydrogenase family protein [SAR86 cluster bacterium]MCS5553181.1 acyl-CoA dehydrogenase family protein [SAR324 cluster bacterium]|tara:strand:- start:389 stop:1609 length:1221 start_codon:yes stop_codon:yes gene_type:complete